MEKVDDSQPSSEPVSPTSNEMMERWRPLRVLEVEAESSEMCLRKIKGVLEKLEGVIDTFYNKRDGTVTVLGYFDPKKLKMELKNEMGDAIKSITDPTKKSILCGRNGTVMAKDYFHSQKSKMILENINFQAIRTPAMRVPELDDSRTQVLNHGENTMKPNKSSLWCYW